MLRDATQAALLEILESNEIPFEHNKAENTMALTDTGSTILFRSVDDFERLRGTNLAWFGIDELTYCPEGAWSRLEGRLRDPRATRLCGFAVWTPKGFDWVYRKFISERVEGYDVTIARPFENRFLLDKVPDFYQRLEKSYSGDFYQQEVLGEYLNINHGLVYKAFDRAIHIREVEPNPARPLLWSLDFNVDPMCSVVAQEQPDGTIHVLDEIVLSRATTEEACDEFMSRYHGWRSRIEIYGDGTGSIGHTWGPSDFTIINNFFIKRGIRNVGNLTAASGNPLVRNRVMLVNAKLQSADGEVGLTVSSRCKELIKDFEEVGWKPGSNQIDKEKDSRRTHVSDALGYLLWAKSSKGPVGEQGQPLGV
jgi:hypothetical protein